jgi:hypothetical protein
MFTKLVGLQYKVVYKKGVENGVADALSRRGHSDSQLLALSAATPAWVSEVINSYEQDNHAASIISKLLLDPAVVPHFTYVDGLVRYKNRIWLGHQPSLHYKIIATVHNSSIGGALGNSCNTETP